MIIYWRAIGKQQITSDKNLDKQIHDWMVSLRLCIDRVGRPSSFKVKSVS
ncbi:protein of unknown function [Shewanella benthica]|uniref:Uncharacterized protein n=1 Tax=Shewanella benthica TaxID=43661 RepID=A0A330M4X4_9GAMM|nr:protein of unknown function [Shewanella benthica]